MVSLFGIWRCCFKAYGGRSVTDGQSETIRAANFTKADSKPVVGRAQVGASWHPQICADAAAAPAHCQKNKGLGF
jgi:hypothetical protein